MTDIDFDFKAFLRRHRDWFPRFAGVFCRVNKRTRSGRIYPAELMARELERLAAQPGGVIGYLPHEGRTALEHAAFLVEHPRVVHDGVQGSITFLDTQAGRKLKAYMEAGGNVGFSTEGIGTVDAHGVVQDDFHLCGIIATPTPRS